MSFSPQKNFEESRKQTGYVPRKEATQKTYDQLGFMSGLEVHQQLLTKEKLFCHCPAGLYNDDDDFDAEIVRHMRPTLSELGEYDGTALMEFKTRKNITYRINNENACTYEIDDTPPFPLNRKALEQALEISSAGLKARRQPDWEEVDEGRFLAPLFHIVENKKTRAERLLDCYYGEWNGDLNQLFHDPMIV